MANPILYGGTGSPQSVLEASTTKHHRIGTRGHLPDGRVFYYANNTTTALVKGQLLSAVTPTAGHDDMAVTSAATGLVTGSKTVSIETGATDLVAGEYQNGLLFVNSATAIGSQYSIDNNPAHDHSADPTAVIELLSPAIETGDATSTITLQRNPYYSPVVSPASAAVTPAVGVALVDVPLGSTDEQFFWCQTWGIAAVLSDATVGTAGEVVVQDPNSAGGLSIATAATEQVVGVAMKLHVDTDYCSTMLTLNP